MKSKGAFYLLTASTAVFLMSVFKGKFFCECESYIHSCLTPVLASGMGAVLTYNNPRWPGVALTFDDGPSQYTPQVLTILQRYEGKAAFFTIGQNVTPFPSSRQYDPTAGNAVGNHSFTHPHLTDLPSPMGRRSRKSVARRSSGRLTAASAAAGCAASGRIGALLRSALRRSSVCLYTVLADSFVP
ncbi:MAG TPA: polysaccharide deacetylase family protein [Ktedonobacteraceae bacterium]|nr:polysaccharide deacetylase family protein [Ktedonobacteraceae bacterium]